MKKEIQYPTTGDEFYFQWYLTERCNLKCLHCYQNKDALSEIPLQDLLVIVDKMEDALTQWGKRRALSLTGGEPFLRRDDLPALQGIRRTGFNDFVLGIGIAKRLGGA